MNWHLLAVGLACISASGMVSPKQEWLERFEKSSLTELGWEGGNSLAADGDHFVIEEAGNRFVRSRYLASTEAKYIRKEVQWDTEKFPWLRWKWRVQKFPQNASVMDPARSDAAAQIYLLWRSFPKYYVLKYFWASSDPVGTLLIQGNLFLGRLYGNVLRSGGATGVWQTECRNIAQDFEKAFDRKPPGQVRGIALLSDADETHSTSEADYDDFEIRSTATDEKPFPDLTLKKED